MAVKKNAFYKVYDSSGTYITTWNVDVISKPSFTWSINGSLGEMNIQLARSIDDFGETEDVAMFNRVETWIQDGDAVNGIRIHTGFIASYEININADGKKIINVHVVSYTVEAEKLVAKDGSGNTTLIYNSYEPADIMKDLLNKMNQTLTYNSSSIENTDTTVSYTFKYATFLEAIKKVIELTPVYWYWYIDSNNLVHLHKTDFNTIDHTLFIGREAQSINWLKTVENMYNTVFFLGEDPLYKKYENTGSSALYGNLEYRIQDTRVSVAATALIVSQKFLDESDHFEQEVKVVILDNNTSDGQHGGTKGYDIESLKPGDVMKINYPQKESKETLWYDDAGNNGNFMWDESFWDFDIRFSLGIPMQIQSINYQFHKAEVTLSTKLPDISKRIEDVKRNLIVEQSINVPTIPS